jgi:hypothetical protein
LSRSARRAASTASVTITEATAATSVGEMPASTENETKSTTAPVASMESTCVIIDTTRRA